MNPGVPDSGAFAILRGARCFPLCVKGHNGTQLTAIMKSWSGSLGWYLPPPHPRPQITVPTPHKLQGEHHSTVAWWEHHCSLTLCSSREGVGVGESTKKYCTRERAAEHQTCKSRTAWTGKATCLPKEGFLNHD